MTPEALYFTIVSINNAGRPGLNHLYTKYWILNTNWPSTSVENPLQIDPFMQNKPNFQIREMNASSINTRAYENKIAFRPRKNKPNQTQFLSAPLQKWAIKIIFCWQFAVIMV